MKQALVSPIYKYSNDTNIIPNNPRTCKHKEALISIYVSSLLPAVVDVCMRIGSCHLLALRKPLTSMVGLLPGLKEFRFCPYPALCFVFSAFYTQVLYYTRVFHGLKMPPTKDEDLARPAISEDAKFESGAKLNLEIRLAIWGLVYTAACARIVEVQTSEHDHYSKTHRWCPRYSPSPPPLVVNICREAREEARRLARAAGHLLFTTTSSNPPDIYFNPAIDTLYVPNDKNYWIRDWGPEGVLTQVKAEPRPQLLRSLAIELDPLTRGTTSYFLQRDIADLQGLEEVILIVKKAGKAELDWVKKLDRSLHVWLRDTRRLRERLGTGKSIRPPCLEECKIALKRGVQFEFINKALG